MLCLFSLRVWKEALQLHLKPHPQGGRVVQLKCSVDRVIGHGMSKVKNTGSIDIRERRGERDLCLNANSTHLELNRSAFSIEQLERFVELSEERRYSVCVLSDRSPALYTLPSKVGENFNTMF